MDRPTKELSEAYDKLLVADAEARKWKDRYTTLHAQFLDYKAQMRHQVANLLELTNG